MPGPKTYRYWKTTEVAQLKELWGKKPYQEIAQMLGRSNDSVLIKASRLKLESQRWVKHPKMTEAALRDLLDKGYHATQIAEHFNTSTKSVYNTIDARFPETLYLQLLRNTRTYNQEHGRILSPRYRAGQNK